MDPKKAAKEAIETLKTLIGIPSFSGDEDQAASFIFQTLDAYFPGYVERRGNNVIAMACGAKKGPTLLLCSHIDTVFPGAQWTRDPFQAKIEGDKLYGLGSNDAGASLVSMLAAARIMATKPFAGNILLAFVAEEESGTKGFCAVEKSLPRYDAAVFGEPTGLRIAASMRGNFRFRMHSHGVSCHASMPQQGKNAIDAFCADLAAIRAIDLADGSPWGGATIEPTMIVGGESPNQIPATIETTFDVRTTPQKHNIWVVHQITGTGVDFTLERERRNPMFTPPHSRIVAAARKACGEGPDCIFNGSCDMAYAKAPSIILGPGDLSMAHVADECTSLRELRKAVQVYSKLLDAYFSKP